LSAVLKWEYKKEQKSSKNKRKSLQFLELGHCQVVKNSALFALLITVKSN